LKPRKSKLLVRDFQKGLQFPHGRSPGDWPRDWDHAERRWDVLLLLHALDHAIDKLVDLLGRHLAAGAAALFIEQVPGFERLANASRRFSRCGPVNSEEA